MCRGGASCFTFRLLVSVKVWPAPVCCISPYHSSEKHQFQVRARIARIDEIEKLKMSERHTLTIALPFLSLSNVIVPNERRRYIADWEEEGEKKKTSYSKCTSLQSIPLHKSTKQHAMRSTRTLLNAVTTAAGKSILKPRSQWDTLSSAFATTLSILSSQSDRDHFVETVNKGIINPSTLRRSIKVHHIFNLLCFVNY